MRADGESEHERRERFDVDIRAQITLRLARAEGAGDPLGSALDQRHVAIAHRGGTRAGVEQLMRTHRAVPGQRVAPVAQPREKPRADRREIELGAVFGPEQLVERLVAHAVHHRREQRVSIGEVHVERAPGVAGFGADLVEAGVEPSGREEPRRRLDQRLARSGLRGLAGELVSRRDARRGGGGDLGSGAGFGGSGWGELRRHLQPHHSLFFLAHTHPYVTYGSVLRKAETMRALVTGSAGFIGSHVVRVLLEAGHDVRAMHLPADDLRNLRGLDVERFPGDVTDEDALARAMVGRDWVFHLAALYRLWTPDPQLMHRINVEGTRKVLAAAKQAGVLRVVHTSSIARFGGQGPGRRGDETSAFALGITGDAYAQSKADAHEIALAAAASGQDVVLVAPTGPVGPGDVGPTPTGKIMIAAASAPVLLSPETTTNLADVRDMARGHLLAAERGKAGESYLLGHRDLTVREVAEMVARVRGEAQPFVEVPFGMATLAGHGALFASRHVTGAPPLVTPAAVAISKLGLAADCTKAVRELGLPQTPLEIAVRDALTWWEREGYLPRSRRVGSPPRPPREEPRVAAEVHPDAVTAFASEPAAIEIATLIIGAGISGIGAAIRLAHEGHRDFVVLEKAASLGGTWRDNTYPGAACDVPSALYSYSFAQRPDWSEAFASQHEILRYLRDVAARFDVVRHIRFGADVRAARWDEAGGRWIVETSVGTFHARVLVSCAGYLHEPKLPAVPGLDGFGGRVFHSSRWDHDHDLAGKRVAVVGSGASAVQIIPRIVDRVATLAVFQRTPHWVLPKPNHPVPEVEASFFRLPHTLAGFRTSLEGLFEALGQGFSHPRLMRRFQRVAEAQLERQVRDPSLRAQLTPGYLLGCKRVLLANDYYPALQRPHVRVHPTALARIEGNTLVGESGATEDVDTVVLCTGFHVSDPPIATRIHAEDGRSLADVWAGSPTAFRGTTVHGFPNFFLVLGPNLGIGHNSAFLVIEGQLDYLVGALRHMAAYGLDRLEVRAAEQAAYNEGIQQALAGSVWNTGGCQSYYLDANGRNSICWPHSTYAMRAMLRTFDAESYETRSRTTTSAARTSAG